MEMRVSFSCRPASNAGEPEDTDSTTGGFSPDWILVKSRQLLVEFKL